MRLDTDKTGIKLSFNITTVEHQALQAAVQDSGLKTQAKFLRQVLRQALGDYLLNNYSAATTNTTTNTINGGTIDD